MPSCSGASGYTSATFPGPPGTPAAIASACSWVSRTSGSMAGVIRVAPSGMARGGTVTSPPAAATASAAGVGAWNSARTATVTPRSRSRCTRLTASSECPPSSKKLSSAPTRSSPSTSANAAQMQLLPHGGRAAARRGGVVRGRQRLAVDLAVRGERNRRQHHDGRRGHVPGQPGRHGLPHGAGQRVRVGLGVARHHVADEPLVAGGVLADRHRRLRDAGAGGERGFYLTELDPEATDLHLVIGPAGELEDAGGRPAGQVPGPVHPLARPRGRVRHEPLRGQRGAVQVAAGQPAARHVQLTRDPGRDRLQPAVKHQDLGAGHRAPDARRLAGGQRLAHRRGDGVLGGAVPVAELAAGRPPVDRLRGERLTDGQQHPHRGERARLGDPQDRGRCGQVGDAMLVRHPDQPRRAGQLLGARHHQGRAAAERGHQLPDQAVEAGRGELQHPAPRPASHLAGLGQQPVQARVRQHRALGRARGTRGVDHVRRMRGDGRQARACGPAVRRGQVRRRQREHGHAGVRQQGRLVRGGDDERRSGVGEHERDPPGRVVHVDGQVGGSCPGHREQRGHQLR